MRDAAGNPSSAPSAIPVTPRFCVLSAQACDHCAGSEPLGPPFPDMDWRRTPATGERLPDSQLRR